MRLDGIDISKFQGQPDFDKVHTSLDFIFIKASEGVGYTDGQFLRNQSEIRRVGITLGYYHFARPDLGNTPEAEAEWFLKVVGTPKNGEMLALDFEVSYQDPVGWCKKFLDHLSSLLGGYKPLIYLNLSTIQGHDWSSVINSNYGLWLAHYDFKTDLLDNTSWSAVAFKQYSDAGTINGISGKVDLDSFYGDYIALAKYGYFQTIVVPPSQPPTTTPTLTVLDDKAKLDTKGEDGIQEWGAIKSMLGDRQHLIDSKDKTILVLNDQVVSLTQQLTDCKASRVPSNVGNPQIAPDVTVTNVIPPTPTVVLKEPTFSNFFANLCYQLAVMLQGKG